MTFASLLGSLLLLAALAAGAARDVATRTIPNRLSLGLALAFPPFALMAGLGGEAVVAHAAAGGLVLLGGFALFAGGWLGGGDAKLAAAAALWLGPAATPVFLLATMLAGGVFAALILALRARPVPNASGLLWLRRLAAPEEGLPYAVALFAGGALALPRSALWTGF